MFKDLHCFVWCWTTSCESRLIGIDQGCPTGGLGAGFGPPAIFFPITLHKNEKIPKKLHWEENKIHTIVFKFWF